MKNVLLASATPPELPNMLAGMWPDLDGEPVYDLVLEDDAELPIGTVVGSWDFATGAMLEQHAGILDIMPGGVFAQFHLWAGQAARVYA